MLSCLWGIMFLKLVAPLYFSALSAIYFSFVHELPITFLFGINCVGCIMGDEVDGVPGIQNVAPGFGRKTALKLLKKHGSLQNLLDAAAVRTVGKQYAQDALTKHSDYLRRNYEILALRRWFVSFIYP